MNYLTTYYWKINAWDNHSINTTSPTWNFTTQQYSGGAGGYTPTSEPENTKPVTYVSFGELYQGYTNSEITFNGSKSHDPDGNITEWFWEFGDNTNGTGETVQHTYSKTGTYIVTLKVIDNKGAIDTNTTTCVITQPNRPPTTPVISGPLEGNKNKRYSYAAVSTDPDNDTIQYSITWGDQTSYANTSVFLPSGTPFGSSHSWTIAGRYDVIVTVTDNQTQISSKITVYIDAEQISDIGYLIDNDGDGIYDAFFSDLTKQTTTVQWEKGEYHIDSDGNGEWDYTYDATKKLISYQPSKTPGFELVIIFFVIVVIIQLLRRKRNV